MKFQSKRGSILLSTLSFVIMLATAAASILELTMNSYRLTMRNELRVEARLVAESELEAIYFKAFAQILVDQPASSLPTLLSGYADVSTTADIYPDLTHQQPAFLPEHQLRGWRIARSISYVSGYDTFTGMIPQTTKHGTVTYITVRVVVQPEPHSPFAQTVVVRAGRRFEAQKSSIFQYNVFFQGDLELQPGGNIEIKGDIAANGSIYAAAQSGGSLLLDAKIRYLATGYFDKDSTGATVLRKPDTPAGGSLLPPSFAIDQAHQVETLSAPENLLGGVDANEVQARRTDLFPTVNDVYRAAILPPPGHTEEYPAVADDPTIGAQRMYNRAGLIAEVDASSHFHIYLPDGVTDVTALYPGVVTDGVNKPVFDAREQKDVGVTTIDMGALKTALETNYPGNNFNGAIYFNLRASDASNPKAIRLVNATKIYAASGKGLTVTTNGGVYVKGDYNTVVDPAIDASLVNRYTVPASGSTPAYDEGFVPAMIMADQVTVLSSGWDDANATLDKTARATTDTAIHIQAGILTGNTPASPTVASGGAQNLVRFLEHWGHFFDPVASVDHPGGTVEFFGSLGRLFDSKTFTANWDQPGSDWRQVYGSPLSRTYVFDPKLRDSPPAGSPFTTAFLRGTFFTW